MRDILLDIAKHTGDLGFLEIVKITGSKDETLIQSMDKDKLVVLSGSLKEPCVDLEGEFGLNNLNLLKFYANFANFKTDDATIKVARERRGDRDVVAEIQFASADNESSATYRVMNPELVPDQPKFIGSKWDFEFSPSQSKIAEFSDLSSGLVGIETYFSPKIDKDGNLRFYIGDENAATNKANMIFEKNIVAELPTGLYWPIDQVLKVLKLAGTNNATMSFMAKGVLRISFDSKFGSWGYIFPSKRK